MASEILASLPVRHGHFLLESGYHSDRWLDLEGLFHFPAAIAPIVGALADKLRRHSPSGICGPLIGGAFLAHALAGQLGARFYYTEPGPGAIHPGLFQATYGLPVELRRRARGERMAVVDDVISAGSSVQATMSGLLAAGATTVCVGAILILGTTGLEKLREQSIPVATIASEPLNLWPPASCPLCEAAMPLQSPHAKSDAEWWVGASTSERGA